MAQFDVYRLRGGELVVDCQSDFADLFDTRFVVPLVAASGAGASLPRFNPAFTVDGRVLLLTPQFAAAVPKRELGNAIQSLRAFRPEILAALDILIVGF